MEDHISDIVTYIGRRIRERRAKQQMTLRDLAREADLSVAFLCDVENGKRRISSDRLYGVAVVLGCRLSTLFP